MGADEGRNFVIDGICQICQTIFETKRTIFVA